MHQQYKPTEEQQQDVLMKREYDRLDIRQKEIENRLSNAVNGSFVNRYNRSGSERMITNANNARLDYEVDMKNIERERERLDIKYGNGKYAELNLLPKERVKMANIQNKYDQLAYREDRVHCNSSKDRARAIIDVVNRHRRIGSTMNESANRAGQRDVSLTVIQRERENLDILYGGEPKNNINLFHTQTPSVTEETTARMNMDQRETKEISLETLSKITQKKQANMHMSEKDKIDLFNGIKGNNQSTDSTNNSLIKTSKIGIHL